MLNPYDILMEELSVIKQMISQSNNPAIVPAEIIGSVEICKRLGISEPTLISWRRKNRIPFIQLDGVIRYNWPKVVEALETRTGKGVKKAIGRRQN